MGTPRPGKVKGNVSGHPVLLPPSPRPCPLRILLVREWLLGIPQHLPPHFSSLTLQTAPVEPWLSNTDLPASLVLTRDSPSCDPGEGPCAHSPSKGGSCLHPHLTRITRIHATTAGNGGISGTKIKAANIYWAPTGCHGLCQEPYMLPSHNNPAKTGTYFILHMSTLRLRKAKWLAKVIQLHVAAVFITQVCQTLEPTLLLVNHSALAHHSTSARRPTPKWKRKSEAGEELFRFHCRAPRWLWGG